MEKVKVRKDLAYDNMQYSIKKLDILLISISGAGIYVCLESIKFLHTEEIIIPIFLKLAGVVFTLTIIFNVLSQWFGYKANRFDYLMAKSQIEDDEKPSLKLKGLIKKYDDLSDDYTKYTDVLNIISISLMLIGLLLLTVYFTLLF